MNRTILLATAAAAFPFTSAAGQAVQRNNSSPTVSAAETGGAESTTAEEAAPPVPGNAEAAHHDQHDEGAIIVTGIKRETADVLGGVSVLNEAELTHEVRPSLGETLARQPGVSSSSFGPTASTPVLRGLTGERVRVLTDGIGSFDLSTAGQDHAVAINPLTAERIEVLRGPAALLFGSNAIGGVVNVIDLRIPRHLPTNAIGVDGILQYGSAANERSGNLAVDVPFAGHFVFHADGSYSKTDDLEIGGFVLSPQARREALASGDPLVEAFADLKGKLPNSRSRTDDYAGGLGYVDGALNIGVSISHHDTKYGVPIRFPLEAGEGADFEQPTIDAHQTRYDVRAEVPLSGVFSQVRLRGGWAKYHHDELTPEGEVDTSFFSKGGEGRLDLVQTDRSGWGGTSGVQYVEKNVHLVGAEKFLPDAKQRQAGIFTLQTLVRGPLRLEAGARVELSKLSADADAQVGNPDLSRQFTTVSGSLGASYDVAPTWRIGLSVSHAERAPSIEELFAGGPHGGSKSFEIGNPDLKPEKSLSFEGSLHHTIGPVHLVGNLFYSHFSNFIFSNFTGETDEDSGLPFFLFQEAPANYYGFELDADAKFGKFGGIDWGGYLISDTVHATIRNFGPAPLIPPFRVLAGITAARGQFDGRLEIEKAFAHNRTAPLETETDGYTMVNAGLDWHPFAANPALTLALQANNIFDVDARRSTSLLKDFASLAGRDIRLSARLNY